MDSHKHAGIITSLQAEIPNPLHHPSSVDPFISCTFHTVSNLLLFLKPNLWSTVLSPATPHIVLLESYNKTIKIVKVRD